jgi:hypothetical protein
MQLERYESAIAGSATLVCRLAHENEHGLQLGSAARLVALGLLCETLRSFRYCGRRPPRGALPVFEANFELDPDRERMHTQGIIVERLRNIGVDRS